METLISDEDGEQQLEDCLVELCRCGYHIKASTQGHKSLLTFGKFFKLFGGREIINVIHRELNIEKSKPAYDIVLNEATDNSVLLHTLVLQILHNEAESIYEVRGFIIKEP